MPLLNKSGWYLCNVVEWAAREAKESKAISLSLKLETVGVWNETDKTWNPTEAADGFGDWWLFGKEGKLNESALDQLNRAKVWSGDFLTYDSPPPTGLQVVVQFVEDTYQGKTKLKANWLHDAEHIPGTGAIANRANRERLMDINKRCGAVLRAAAKPTMGTGVDSQPF